MRLFTPALLCSSLLCASPAVAETDWFTALYTPEGIELRTDENVLTLYALFNALGYDDAKLVRSQPFPKRQFHPLRQAVRTDLTTLDAETRRQAEAFVDAHAVPAERYVAAALGSGGADLKGLEAVLKQVRERGKLDDRLAQITAEQRKLLKTYLPALDGPMQRARKLLKQPESESVVLLVNVLEAHDRAFGGQQGSHRWIMVGPSEAPNIEGVVQEYARTALLPIVSKHVAKWTSGPRALREAQGAGVRDRTVAEYAAGVLGMAVALRATQAKPAAFDTAADRGYFGVREAAARLEEAGSVESWVADAMERLKRI